MPLMAYEEGPLPDELLERLKQYHLRVAEMTVPADGRREGLLVTQVQLFTGSEGSLFSPRHRRTGPYLMVECWAGHDDVSRDFDDPWFMDSESIIWILNRLESDVYEWNPSEVWGLRWLDAEEAHWACVEGGHTDWLKAEAGKPPWHPDIVARADRWRTGSRFAFWRRPGSWWDRHIT